MRILITGGTGTIGPYLIQALLERRPQAEIHIISRRDRSLKKLPQSCRGHKLDLRRLEDLVRLQKRLKPDFVFHLAAKTDPGRDFKSFEDQRKNTITPAINVALSLQNPQHAFFFGSCEEYGNSIPPFSEDQFPVAFSPYGWAKISSFFAVQSICLSRKLNWSWLRPFLVYGPGKMSGKLLPALFNACLENRELKLTEGLQTRDFVYGPDLGKMIVKILEQPEKAQGQIVNLGSGIPQTIRAFAKEVQRIAGGGQLLFGALSQRESEAMAFYSSMKKYEALYGKVIRTPLEVAIQESCSGIRKHGNS